MYASRFILLHLSVDMLLTNTKALFALVVTHAHAKALHATMFDKSLAFSLLLHTFLLPSL